MTWKHQIAQERIKKSISDAPKIEVQKFFEDYLPLYESQKNISSDRGLRVTPPLFALKKDKVVLVDTVQIYVSITNYDKYRIEAQGETPEIHAKVLKFLHFHYSACDRVIENGPAQRVDFHGDRMHAVILGSNQEGVTAETIVEAFAFVRDLQNVAAQANKQLADAKFTAQFRIGIDTGFCVAINNGTGLEQEPMFLGSPANHAAKLAIGDDSGTFVSDRVREKLSQPVLGHLSESKIQLDASMYDRLLASRDEKKGVHHDLDQSSPSYIETIVSAWRLEIHSKTVPNPTDPDFRFHYKAPPLSQIKFDDLSPSNSIRMPLVSIYADLSGFTLYVDNAIAQGKIADAVKALHVIREEFKHVVQDDFGGRKVRFIGDCIHALCADGSATETDTAESLLQGAKCAGGLRSSFNLCHKELEGIETLGLSIGVEFGETPISRIGIRGDRSIRVASSKATSISERVQKACDHNETRFGENALKLLPTALCDLVKPDGSAGEMDFDDVSTASSLPAPLSSPAIMRLPNKPAETRAHFSKLWIQ